MMKAYIDAATKENPGPSGAGLLIVSDNLHKQISLPLAIMSNHQAEFYAFYELLTYLIQHHYTNETIFVYSDSKILVQTVDKNYTNNENFQEIFQKIQALLANFSLLILQWIPESKNKGADQLAKQGLQKALRQ
ncbi:ribonuclease HI family protein [Enterococcus saigonensis]|uniref:ribonuclease HI family protein n=1 Tax=Enterococcus saigonensis TaxID=1805431 RepID=UPI0015675147|nr:ribonuclease HI family protein [Enterococcus saigonensis]